MLLSNYVCFVLWFYAAFTFFDDRIFIEEQHLCRFFDDYQEYADKTPIGIPWIVGYCDVKVE